MSYLFMLAVLALLLMLTSVVGSFKFSSIIGRNHIRRPVSALAMTSTPKKIEVAGWTSCGAFQQAKQALNGLQTIFPTKFAVTVHESRFYCLQKNS